MRVRWPFTDQEIGDYLGVSGSWVHSRRHNKLSPANNDPEFMIILAHRSRLELNSIRQMPGPEFIQKVVSVMLDIDYGSSETLKKLRAAETELAEKYQALKFVDSKINPHLAQDTLDLAKKIKDLKYQLECELNEQELEELDAQVTEEKAA
jgi:hypothetical protein